MPSGDTATSCGMIGPIGTRAISTPAAKSIKEMLPPDRLATISVPSSADTLEQHTYNNRAIQSERVMSRLYVR